MSDRTLTCSDCGSEFTFTAGEQEFYTQRGYSEPRRCQPCRQARKTQRNQADSGFGGGYGDSSGFRSGGGGGGGQRQFYPAVCSECGQETEVPFSPTPGKPVYCRDCFQSRRSPRYSAY